MDKKYGFTGKTMEMNRQTFHQIVALMEVVYLNMGIAG